MTDECNQLHELRIEVASPCQQSWEAMVGDDRSRFCNACQLNVYNISDMTDPEARALITEKEGRLCVRFFEREDGTVLTQDCPVGLKTKLVAAQCRLQWVAASLVGFVLTGAASIGLVPHSWAESVNPSGQYITGGMMPPDWKPTPTSVPDDTTSTPVEPPAPLLGKVKAPEPPPTEIKGEPTMGVIAPGYIPETKTPCKTTKKKKSNTKKPTKTTEIRGEVKGRVAPKAP